MNNKKLRRLFAAAIICIFVLSMGFSCAAESASVLSADTDVNMVLSADSDVDQAPSDEVADISGELGVAPDRGDLFYNCTEPRLVDNADLLTDGEEQDVLNTLNQFSEELKFDIVVVTENTIGSKTPMEYADDYYDYTGYGYGENYDGVLLLVSMENRDYWISTCGFGIDAITTYGGVEYVENEFLDYLGSGDYATAFTTFATACKALVENAVEGNYYDRYEDADNNYYFGYYNEALEFYTSHGNSFKEVNYFGGFIFALIAGLVIAYLAVKSMKSKLKSVSKKQSASNYVVDDSIRLERREDRFLYSNVYKVKIPTETKSSGGSGGFKGSSGGTHVSSSGRSHGGGGGHF